MGKYDPLRDYLLNETASELTLSFREIERIIGAPYRAAPFVHDGGAMSLIPEAACSGLGLVVEVDKRGSFLRKRLLVAFYRRAGRSEGCRHFDVNRTSALAG